MLTCYLCNQETVYTTYFCADCNYIKRVIHVYGREEIKDIVTKVCIRNKQQMQNKIDIIKDKMNKEEKKKEEKKVLDPKAVPFADTSVSRYNLRSAGSDDTDSD